MTKRIYLNFDWKFSDAYEEEMLIDENYSSYEDINLPHTCKETPFNYFDENIYQMVSFYKKNFVAPVEWEHKRIIITFEGVAHRCEVYINGNKAGEHSCGYTGFTIDITRYLNFGEENIVAVVVDSREINNIPPFGYVVDYMTYGGIYRDVYIEVKNNIYIKDVYFIPKITKINNGTANVGLKTQFTLNKLIEEDTEEKNNNVSNKTDSSNNQIELRQFIRKKNENEFILLGKTQYSDSIMLDYSIESISLWDINNPNLYEIKTQLLIDNKLCDENIIEYGFRKSEFRKDGYYLNNKKVKILGLNRHQSYPYVGYAMPKSMQREDARILKYELGLNAVRTSHYPQSHDFISACDEFGLLVFTEIPGWQYIGNDDWKNQAVENTRDMVLQYRNHTSIVLWGVRINESKDDNEFYKRTNDIARRLDGTRPTAGVRCYKNSNLLEDVYTYNDFSHNGSNSGCEQKKNVTSNMKKPYLISEYNGHMFPTKSFDCEEHRVEHAIRHARVINDVLDNDDIVGSFGWCMADYNTHKDFGSGDRICYHGVMDMYRNPKLAAVVYNSLQDNDINLSILSSMDIGEHPECNRGKTWIISNGDSVKMYKNERLIKEYKTCSKEFKKLTHGPVLIDDYIGNAIVENEKFKPKQANAIKEALNATALYGLSKLPKKYYLTALKMIVLYGMKPNDAVTLYNKYIGDWGGTSTTYKFEAIKDGKVVKTVIKQPMTEVKLKVLVSHTQLKEDKSYDVAAIRIYAKDEFDNILPYFNHSVSLKTDGDVQLIGPNIVSLQGGMGGTYVKSCGKSGIGSLTLKDTFNNVIKIEFTIER